MGDQEESGKRYVEWGGRAKWINKKLEESKGRESGGEEMGEWGEWDESRRRE